MGTVPVAPGSPVPAPSTSSYIVYISVSTTSLPTDESSQICSDIQATLAADTTFSAVNDVEVFQLQNP